VRFPTSLPRQKGEPLKVVSSSTPKFVRITTSPFENSPHKKVFTRGRKRELGTNEWGGLTDKRMTPNRSDLGRKKKRI